MNSASFYVQCTISLIWYYFWLQVQTQNFADASEGNFLTMEMEGIPQ